jgi:YfdX protein
MKLTLRRTILLASLMSLAGLVMTAPSISADSALPAKPQAQSEASQSVQPNVDKQTADAAAEKRKKLFADATAALNETHKALKALENKNTDVALKALAEVTGKLDLIVARDPKLALTPVDTEVITYDVLSNFDTIKSVIQEAKAHLNDGEIQKARPLVANLASEIQYRTRHIPLATYPAAIKAIVPLIDAGKIDEAKTRLQAALNTLVVTTDDVIPLPKLRAEHLLKQAQELAEKKDRSKEENDKLTKNLQAAREQLQVAELLGYGKKTDFNPIYQQISEIENKSAGGKSGTGWFEKLKQQLADMF